MNDDTSLFAPQTKSSFWPQSEKIPSHRCIPRLS
jgi:hypothetical protein